MPSLPSLAPLSTRFREIVDTALSGAPGARSEKKQDGSWVTDIDRGIQDAVQDWLRESWPQIGFLGEEMTPEDQATALNADTAGVWVLDPLDGTSNFRAGLPAYSSTLALIRDGQVVLGLVYDPCRNEMFTARRGEGAWLDGKPLRLAPEQAPALNEAIAAVDFKRLPPALACRLASQPPYASQRSIGSIALDWCWVAAGRFHVYVHGKQKLWDHAAGALILAEAGGAATTLETGSTASGTDEPLSLRPRSAVCATSATLLEAWRRTLES